MDLNPARFFFVSPSFTHPREGPHSHPENHLSSNQERDSTAPRWEKAKIETSPDRQEPKSLFKIDRRKPKSKAN